MSELLTVTVDLALRHGDWQATLWRRDAQGDLILVGYVVGGKDRASCATEARRLALLLAGGGAVSVSGEYPDDPATVAAWERWAATSRACARADWERKRAARRAR